MSQTIDEDDIQKVRQGLMEFLCKNTRHNVRHNKPTDFEIEKFRVERFSTIPNRDYFNRIVTIIAERYTEIEVKGSVVRLSPIGLDKCGQYVKNLP